MILLFGLALAATAPVDPGEVALDNLTRSGDLMVAPGDQPKRRKTVLEIQVSGCVVAFKTKIMFNGFEAQMIDIGQGGKIERAGRHTVRLRGSTRFPKVTVLVFGGETKKLFERLETVRKSCDTRDGIF